MNITFSFKKGTSLQLLIGYVMLAFNRATLCPVSLFFLLFFDHSRRFGICGAVPMKLSEGFLQKITVLGYPVKPSNFGDAGC